MSSSAAATVKSILILLLALVKSSMPPRVSAATISHCLSERLIARGPGGRGFVITGHGRTFLARHRQDQAQNRVDAFRARHLALATRDIVDDNGDVTRVVVDDNESPIARLALRGRITGMQFNAGEKLRNDFTRGLLTPRVTSNWEMPTGSNGAGGVAELSDAAVAARQRVNLALKKVGPEFSGLLLDVCCFLRGLEDIERERKWPAFSAKVVLQLGLDRLARHYGLTGR